MNNVLYNTLMLIGLLAFVTLFSVWVMSVAGCASPQTASDINPGADLCIPRADQAKDPCELEFWEDRQFEKYGR